MFRCETVVDSVKTGEQLMTARRVDGVIADLLADGWMWLVCKSAYMALHRLVAGKLEIVRFVR